MPPKHLQCIYKALSAQCASLGRCKLGRFRTSAGRRIRTFGRRSPLQTQDRKNAGDAPSSPEVGAAGHAASSGETPIAASGGACKHRKIRLQLFLRLGAQAAAPPPPAAAAEPPSVPPARQLLIYLAEILGIGQPFKQACIHIGRSAALASPGLVLVVLAHRRSGRPCCCSNVAAHCLWLSLA